VNDFSGKNLQLLQGHFSGALGRITIFVALLAGSYPSLFLSAFKPAETLKGTFRNSARAMDCVKAW